MDNQHRKISGYRELTQAEIDLMNKVKDLAQSVKTVVDQIEYSPSNDRRWVDAAKMSLQTGFMQLTRAIAKPSTF